MRFWFGPREAIALGLILFTVNAGAEYGDIILNKTADSMRQADVDDVVFPHWFHRIRFRCFVCHEEIFQLKAGSNEISMETITTEAEHCGRCHDGLIAWEPLECDKCHSLEPGWSGGPVQHATKEGEPEVFIKGVGKKAKPYAKFLEIAAGWHPVALTKSGLPLDRYGLVDWAAAVREEIVRPLWSLDPKNAEAPPQMRKNKILFEVKSDSMPDVVFPHEIHSYWLQCEICHGAKGEESPLFIDEAGGNDITMEEIGKGEWCGRCHDKIGFPINDCVRCHDRPKGLPLEAGMIRRIKKVEPEPMPEAGDGGFKLFSF